MFGRKHSDVSKKIMSDAQKKSENSGRFKKGENHPNYGKTLNDDTKKIMSDAKKGEKNPNYGQTPSKETRKKISDALKGKNSPNSSKIEVTDIKNNTTNSYDSIREAARALNINNATIVKYFANNQQKPYKGQYTFKKL
jgi:group I intron endonuclease